MKELRCLALMLVLSAWSLESSFGGTIIVLPIGPDDFFRRADANNDSVVTIADAQFILNYLYINSQIAPSCLDAADANDDGQIQLADAQLILNVLFNGVGVIAEPRACGSDPTLDALGCLSSICPTP